MDQQDIVIDYLTRLKGEVTKSTQDSKVLCELIEEYRTKIETLKEEGLNDSFMEELNLFEDLLDSKILIT